MKISVVTISYNQVKFLERTIRSVIEQKDAAFEYIIVDSGSTDGSRELIERFRGAFAATILEPDAGPADGLNKGFARATGEIFFCLNSDDTVEPGAFASVLAEFARDPELDIVCGHGWVVDQDDRRLRRAWSDPYSPLAVAYGASIQIQPSTYFRSEMFHKVGGFNVKNRSGWDGELFVDMCLAGARVKILDRFMSSYRLHEESITTAGVAAERMRDWRRRLFRKIMGRDMSVADKYLEIPWRLYRQVRNPKAFFERLFHGPIYRRKLRAR